LSQHIKYKVEIKGEVQSDVARLAINQSIHGHHDFQIELSTDYSGVNTSKFDSARNLIGASVMVEFESYLEEKQKSQFKGVITSVGISQQDSSTSRIILKGFAPTILMDGLKHSNSFLEKKLGELFNEIVKKHPTNVLGNSNNTAVSDKVPYILQVDESDYNFLSRQAARFGEWLYYDGLNLNLGMPSKRTKHSLKIGGHLSNLEIRMRTAPFNQELTSYDYNADKDYSFNLNKLSADGLLSEAYKHSKQLFSADATGYHQDFSQNSDLSEKISKHIGNTQISGLLFLSGSSAHAGLKIGDTVSISTSDESYGDFTIVKLNHTVAGSSEYENRFMAISADASAPVANPEIFNPQMHSTFATVNENNDPEKMGRIKVKFFWGKNDIVTDWIRVTQAAAGKDYGNYFIPEIGDQVLVDFEHGNPDFPFVASSSYHSKNKPFSDFIDKDNYNKGLITKGGNKIFISDKSKKEQIEISTPKGEYKIVLDCDKKSILVEAKKGEIILDGENVTIKASKNIKLEAGQNLEMKSTKAAKMESMDVAISGSKGVEVSGAATAEIKSNGKASLSGNGTTEVKSSGMVQVQGSLVKIN